MMAISITDKFLNRDKREYEAIVVTLPATLSEGGGRTKALPTYVQYGEDYLASVVPSKSVIDKAYVVIDEPYPAGTLATISLKGTAIFTDVPLETAGVVVSTTEDILVTTAGDISITLSGGTGDATTGKIMVVANYVPFTVKNGRFADAPVV